VVSPTGRRGEGDDQLRHAAAGVGVGERGKAKAHLKSIKPSGRVVVGMSSIPSRLDAIAPALDSIRHQARPPDVVFLSLPECSVREHTGYVIPEWLAADSLVQIVRTPVDYGPGTKLLGCLPHLAPSDTVVLMDDDLSYHPFVVGDLADEVSDASVAASFFVYESRGIRVGQGADGFAMLGAAAFACGSIVDLAMAHQALRFHDDYWTSFQLRRAGVSVRDLSPKLAGHGVGRSYEVVHEINSLLATKGELSRMTVNKEANRLLYRYGDPTLAMRADRLVGYARGAVRVARRAARRSQD
jgi:hypothetical protein